MAVQQASNGRPDGASFGQSATDLVSLYGVTPAAQPANIVDATDAATAITKLNEVIAALETVGITAA